MEVLKTVLRRSIRKKAWQVTLAVGEPAKIENDRGSDEIELDQAVDEAALDQVFRFLFPKDFDKLKAKKPVQGALKVPNIGTIHVIAQYPKTLHLFIPPDGNEKFHMFWDEVNAASSHDLTGARDPEATAKEATEKDLKDAVSKDPEPIEPVTPEAQTPPPISVQPPQSAAPPDNVVDVSESFAGGLGPNTTTGMKPVPTDKTEIDTTKEKELAPPEDTFVPGLAKKPEPDATESAAEPDPFGSTDFDPNISIGLKTFDAENEAPVTETQNQPPPPASPTPKESDMDMAFVPDQGQVPGLSSEPAPFPEAREPAVPPPSPAQDTLAELPSMPSAPHDISSNAISDSPGVQDSPFATPVERLGQGTPPPNEPIRVNFGVDHDREGLLSDGFNSVDDILRQMIAKGASDVHLTTGLPVSFRIDGDIVRQDSATIDASTMESFLTPITPPYNMEEVARTNDTDFAYEIRDVGRFRVNIFRDRMGISAVLRHIPAEIKTASDLGLPQAVYDLTKLNKGLVLVTGPTGSGKSTTLAAMLHEINRSRSQHIITIEDPIEYIHPQLKCLVHQREVHRHTSSFGKALRAALREDPDVVLIGELRDLETIATAIETAETGHLVLGTLHTNSATSTVARIIDMFPSEQQEQVRQMLASSLKGVLTQTLVKRKTGGRAAAFEVLMVNDAAGAMVREGKTHMLANHMQTQKAAGNVLLNDSLMHLVKTDQVNPIEAYSKAADKKAFGDMLRRAGFQIKFEGGGAPPQAGSPRGGNYRAG